MNGLRFSSAGELTFAMRHSKQKKLQVESKGWSDRLSDNEKKKRETTEVGKQRECERGGQLVGAGRWCYI